MVPGEFEGVGPVGAWCWVLGAWCGTSAFPEGVFAEGDDIDWPSDDNRSGRFRPFDGAGKVQSPLVFLERELVRCHSVICFF